MCKKRTCILADRRITYVRVVFRFRFAMLMFVGLWSLLCTSVTRRLRRRSGSIEPDVYIEIYNSET